MHLGEQILYGLGTSGGDLSQGLTLCFVDAGSGARLSYLLILLQGYSQSFCSMDIRCVPSCHEPIFASNASLFRRPRIISKVPVLHHYTIDFPFIAASFPLIPPTSSPFNQQLFLLLQRIYHTPRNLQRIRHNIRWRQRQPLRQANIRHAITLINLNPHQLLRLTRVLHIMARIVREDGSIAGGEVEGARVGASNEDGGACVPGVEVQPFFGVGVPV